MLHLADVFEGWAMYPSTTPEYGARLLGWADGYRNLADKLGPDWAPRILKSCRSSASSLLHIMENRGSVASIVQREGA